MALTALYAPNGWLGAPLARARHQGRLHAAGRRGGADLRRPALRGAHRASRCCATCDARSRRRPPPRWAPAACRRCVRVVLPALAARAADRLRARLRARRGRIRLGHLHRRQHADDDARSRRCSSSSGWSSSTTPAPRPSRLVMLAVSFTDPPGAQPRSRRILRPRRGLSAAETPRAAPARPRRRGPGLAVRLLLGLARWLPGCSSCCRWPPCSPRRCGTGWRAVLAALAEPDALAAIRLTLLVAAIAVPLNTVVRPGRRLVHRQVPLPRQGLLITLIDLPFSVSPVISGLVCVLLFGAPGLVGAVAAGARHADHLRPAGHRAGHGLRDLPLRGPQADSADAGAGTRRGGGRRHPGRHRLADVPRASRCRT